MTTLQLLHRSSLAAALACALAVPAQAASIVYSNGEVVDAAGLSVLNAPNVTFGYSARAAENIRLADNFFIPDGEVWRVGSISLFAYQTGATDFTFTSASWQIVQGDLNNPSVVAGADNAPVSNEGLVGYRVETAGLADTNRSIYQIGIDIADIDLVSGSYWLVWSIDGTLSSGPWAPVIAFGGDSNAEQSLGGQSFGRVVDRNTGFNAELPFQLNSPNRQANVPEPTSLALVLAAGVAAAAARRRRA